MMIAQNNGENGSGSTQPFSFIKIFYRHPRPPDVPPVRDREDNVGASDLKERMAPKQDEEEQK
jgi:hypothetical protein